MKKRDYKEEYRKRPRWSKVCSWYKSEDKRKGRKNNLNSSQVRVLIGLPCFYCGKEESGGLDRKVNSLGHTEKNCVPCCYKCNMILGDIPFEGKKLLSEALRSLRESGLIDDWTPPNPFRNVEK